MIDDDGRLCRKLHENATRVEFNSSAEFFNSNQHIDHILLRNIKRRQIKKVLKFLTGFAGGKWRVKNQSDKLLSAFDEP